MKSVWKFTLEVVDLQAVLMPKDALILSAQLQREQLCLWAFVDVDAPMENRVIRVLGTGHASDDDESLRFIDTFQAYDGDLIFHVFEVLP